MFDSFESEQFIACSLLSNAIKNNKLSHAYLIDANYYEKAFDFVMAFVKKIICGCNSNINSSDCILCQRIENNNYSEVKIIESQSSVIKKEQMLELQNDFSRSSIEGKYRIYVIKDCDKMNKHASNCLLKFLEEPVPGVIAILMTNNFNKILTTVVSRCQIVRLNNFISSNEVSTLNNLALISCNNQHAFSEFISDESKNNIINDVINFLDYFEENGLDVLLYMNNLWYNKFSTREDSRLAILLIVYFYYDLLKCKLGTFEYFFCDKVDFIQKCAFINTVESILKKIEIVCYCYEMINCNLNINLLLDDMVIKLGDVYEYC